MAPDTGSSPEDTSATNSASEIPDSIPATNGVPEDTSATNSASEIPDQTSTTPSSNGVPEDVSTPSNARRATKTSRILAIALIIVFLASNSFLIFRYGQNMYNDVSTANAAATVQQQTSVAQEETMAPTQTANAATEEAAVEIVPHMTATAIANANATALAVANATVIPYPPTTNPDLNDSLADNNNADLKWGEDNDYFGSCSFSNGKFEITAIRTGFEYCLARGTEFTNAFIYTVQMKIIQGSNSGGGGLVFYADNNTGRKFYHFSIGQDGSYAFSVFDLSRNLKGTILSSGNNQSINTGLTTLNTIAVVVNNDVFQLYVNNSRIAVVGDSSYKRGLIGLSAEYDGSQTTVVFQNVKVWNG